MQLPVLLSPFSSIHPRGFQSNSCYSRFLVLRVRIPPKAWMSVSCVCFVLSGRDLCDGPIPRPEESYRLCCVIVCDLETSRMRRPWPALGCYALGERSCRA